MKTALLVKLVSRAVFILFLNKMISSFYLSRFTADRLGGGKKCIDFVF